MSGILYTDGQQRLLTRVVPDLVRYRGLWWDLVSKELRASYRNAMMGFLWAVLQPMLMMAILTFVFGYLLQDAFAVRSGNGHPYALVLLCGIVPWQFFSNALTAGTHSLVRNQELIKKVYFPREIMPLAAVANAAINTGIGFLTLLAILACVRGVGSLGLGVLYTLTLFPIQLAVVVGLVLLLSPLQVRYRDVTYMLEVALAFGFYATPVFYELPRGVGALPVSESVGAWLHRLYLLNPMAHLITAYRTALLDNQWPPLTRLAEPCVAAVLLLVAGAWVFRRSAPTFADDL